MGDRESTQRTPARASRVLAALDNPAFFASQIQPFTTQSPPATPRRARLKRNIQTPGGSGTSSQKKTRTALEDEGEGALDLASSLRQMTQLAAMDTGEFHLNYDKESPLLHIDRGGEDQGIKLAEFVTRSIDNASNGVTVQAAMDKLGLSNKRDLLPGLEVRLLPHQIIGVAWMVDQECESPHKGGILALSDEMGLGKTVQMIATMTINLPEPTDKYRTTLIVVPAALMQQWKDELRTKTNGIFSVHIHHGKDKLRTVEALMKKDVIITTYQTLCMDFNIPSSIESENEMEYLLDHGGLLSRMKWFRIVTDESQFIRNRRTRASKVVALLRAKYRWCLTGTPVTNTLADIYGFLRFGRFRPWNDWKDFNAHVAKTQLKDAPLAGLRAQEILKPILLRRTKNAQIEGEPILQLPEKHIDLIYLDFSEEERQIYDMFEGRARVMINRYIRENTVFKNNNNILVMILWMRQLCCHPHLILELTREFEDPTLLLSGDGEKEVARASKLLGPEWVMQIKKRFMDRARMSELDFSGDMEQDMEATCPKCGDLFMDNSGRLLACGHEVCKECLSVMQTEDIEVNGELGNGDEKENNRVEKEFETAVTKGLRPCPTCKKMQNLTPSHVFLSQAFEPRRDDVRQAIRIGREQRHQPSFQATKSTKVNDIDSDVLDISSSSDEEMPDLQELLASTASSSPPPPGGRDKVKAKKEPKVKVKGRAVVSDDDDDDSPMDEDADLYDAMKDIHGRRHAQQAKAPKVEPGMSAEMFAHWRRGDDNLESSTKMVAMIEFLRVADAAGDKTIVYSQWTSMLDLIETLFARYGIRSLRYDGRMNREEREIALAEFRQRGGPKVILISIRCGGVGLNLVSANRVVNMDLSWNYATESQAYDRVHRLGQEKEVFVQRLVVKNTIEERMLKLQDTKLGLAEAALGEGSGVKLHKLSVKELKALFGIAPLPTRGQVRVEPPQ